MTIISSLLCLALLRWHLFNSLLGYNWRLCVNRGEQEHW
jgi:hypothetical protein